MSKLLGGYGQQPTSSLGHGGWQQPTLEADLSTWANGLVTGRHALLAIRTVCSVLDL
jgi:hypothetical protein